MDAWTSKGTWNKLISSTGATLKILSDYRLDVEDIKFLNLHATQLESFTLHWISGLPWSHAALASVGLLTRLRHLTIFCKLFSEFHVYYPSKVEMDYIEIWEHLKSLKWLQSLTMIGPFPGSAELLGLIKYLSISEINGGRLSFVNDQPICDWLGDSERRFTHESD